MIPPKSQDHVTLAEARYLALVAQGLEHPEAPMRRPKPTKSEILQSIRQQSVVQLDSISVISRAHETAVFSRLGRYDIGLLNDLHYPDVHVFEYWAHAASLLPIEFLPYVKRKMLSVRAAEGRWGDYIAANRDLHDHVRSTIREAGPVSTRAFERPDGKDRIRWEWYGGKPAKQALDFLWYSGELSIQRRIGFERVYDLTERLFPNFWETPPPPIGDEERFFVERGLASIGIGPLPWITEFYYHFTRRYVDAAAAKVRLAELHADGTAIPVQLDGTPGQAWLHVNYLDALNAFRAGRAEPRRAILLSPFDNLLWRRNRALALFGFDYRLESYTIAPLRQYGYYTLPILAGGHLVGRLDPRFKRKTGVLSIEAIHLEPQVRPSAEIADGIARALRNLLTFLGGSEIVIVACAPEKLLPMLRRRLDP